MSYLPFFATVEASSALARLRTVDFAVTVMLFSNHEIEQTDTGHLPFFTAVEAGAHLTRLRTFAGKVTLTTTAV